MDKVRLLLEENAELERELDAASERIAELESELRAWRSGAKSLERLKTA